MGINGYSIMPFAAAFFSRLFDFIFTILLFHYQIQSFFCEHFHDEPARKNGQTGREREKNIGKKQRKAWII